MHYLQKREDALTKLFFQVTTITMLSLFLVCPLQADEPDVSKEMKEAAAAIAHYSAEQKDAAVKKAHEMMDALDERIDELEKELYANWGELKEATREEYREALISMRRQRNELSEWYGSMRHSSKGAWEEVKKGFSNTYEALAESWQAAENEMEEEMQ